MAQKVRDQYGVVLTRLGALGVSAMMHGYLPFDQAGNQLCGFRTWRNTVTEKEAEELTALFHFNIPQRWSIAHLYRALRLKEPHVGRIAYLTTLAGYVHWQLTGENAWAWAKLRACSPLTAKPGPLTAV